MVVYLFSVINSDVRSLIHTMNSTFSEDDCDVVLSGKEIIPFSLYKKTFILVIVPLVVTFGLFGNAALLFVVYRIQDMRTITNFYLSNLAVSDSMLLINAAFQYIGTYFTQPIEVVGISFPKGYLCAISNFCVSLFYFASVFMVTLVTFERYLSICHPLVHRLVKGKRFTAQMTAVVWLLSLVMACLVLDIHETQKMCIDWPDSSDYDEMPSYFITCNYFETKCRWCWQALAVVDFVQFSLAVTISMFMYGRIIYTLSARSDVFQSEKSSDNHTAAMIFRARNQVARMLILNGTVFFLCLALYEMMNFYFLISWWASFQAFGDEESENLIWIGRLAVTLKMLNSAVNPVLYNVSNGRYRKAFAEAFGCRQKEGVLKHAKKKEKKKTGDKETTTSQSAL